MNGHIIPNTPIAVDFWKVRQCPSAKLFFLTHMHGDHIVGLTPSWNLPIYCSPISKKLLEHQIKIKSALIIPLEVNESHVIPWTEHCQETLTVTVIDAHHCPGAVMFLFQGYFGNILYTGDFRYEPSMFIDSPLADIEKKKVDVLYMDNTYNKKGCEFPTRDQAKDQIIKIIESHPEHRVLIATRELGKEELFVDLATYFQTYIVVSEKHYEKMKVLETKDVFSTEEDAGFIKLLPFYSVSKTNAEKWNLVQPTVVVIPTALYSGLDGSPYANVENVFIVPFSDHSSYSELCEFVSKVKPCEVLPIVRGSRRGVFGTDLQDRADMSCFNSMHSKRILKDVLIPATVKEYMQCKYKTDLQNDVPGDLCKNPSFIRKLKRTREQRNIEKKRTRKLLERKKGVLFCTTPTNSPPAKKTKVRPLTKMSDSPNKDPVSSESSDNSVIQQDSENMSLSNANELSVINVREGLVSHQKALDSPYMTRGQNQDRKLKSVGNYLHKSPSLNVKKKISVKENVKSPKLSSVIKVNKDKNHLCLKHTLDNCNEKLTNDQSIREMISDFEQAILDDIETGMFF